MHVEPQELIFEVQNSLRKFYWLIIINVCLAGAPLFEGRWIPDAGEIIPASSVNVGTLEC